ncbi:MAG: tRNA pseudouridine55 synthase [Actinomycetota bacterium]|nr:tRNA pseudouridine55 synthase [Actinomycetota bacterium]
MNGILVVDKPAGMTSHDVVDRVRKIFSTKKVGHGGTLDPDATGVLVLAVGYATRFIDYTKDAPKRYSATATLGASTTTQDSSGEVVESRPVDVTEDDVRAALKRFEGDIDQIPPMVSAVKIGGEALYRKARRGEEVDRPPRRVTVHSVELLSYDEPAAQIDVSCSGGTYIRTLIHDLGQELGCGAHMSLLRRTASGGFSLDDAVALDDLGPQHLRPLKDALRSLDSVTVSDEEARLVASGRRLPAKAASSGLVAVVHDEEVIAVYRRDGDELVAEKVLGS